MMVDTVAFVTCPNCGHAAKQTPCLNCSKPIPELGGVEEKISVGVEEFSMGVAIVVDHTEVARFGNHRELAHEFKRLKDLSENGENGYAIYVIDEFLIDPQTSHTPTRSVLNNIRTQLLTNNRSPRPKKGGECNRTVCKQIAVYLNNSTGGHYCESGANDIQSYENTRPGSMILFPGLPRADRR